MLKDIIDAYKVISEKKKKQKEFERLKATPLNYMIIKDLINSAYYGIVMEVTLVDGTKLTIKREDAFDTEKQKRYEFW